MSEDDANFPLTGEIPAVAEMQGLYGPFSFPESLLQKIWHRRDFDDADACTIDGRPVKVLHPGKWNRLGGPDFSGARLRIGGAEVWGDVEIHLRAQDWAAHGHAQDPAYANVILHVVLFPPSVSAGAWTAGAGGRRLPVLTLLPLLHYGLEEYATDDAVEHLAGRPLHQAQEVLGALDDTALENLLRRQAEARWTQKVHFARERIRRLGWTDACHHAALEILGHRFNRAPMLAIATAHPLAEWTQGAVIPDALFEEQRERWSLQGVRPLNHPRLRLRQYLAWTSARPDWPERLRKMEWPEIAAATGARTGEVRRAVKMTGIRKNLANFICDNAVGGSRWDNLVCDGFLSLLAAETSADMGTWWWHWFPGDLPEALLQTLRRLHLFEHPGKPAAHGLAQGLLGWILERERQAVTKP